MSEVALAFGARLRSCRQSAGMSQQELSERSGLSVRSISDLERGRTRFPYQDSLNRLADALGLRDPARTEFITAPGRRLARADAADGGQADQDGGSPTDWPGGVVSAWWPRHDLPAAIEDLARAQHAQPVHDPAELADEIWESDAELEAFLAALRAARNASLA